jgi:RNA polymerase sigma factor (sigma-70 family)
MAENEAFTELMKRVRAGDADAAEALVRQYEPYVRRIIRLRVEDRRLGRLFDTMDFCQSVLASFFVRAGAGQFDLEEPEQLVALLRKMVMNKVASAARKQKQQRRDQRRQADLESGVINELAGNDASPSQVVADKDLLSQFRDRLTAEEQAIADLRAQGCGWDEVAAKLGGKAQARRMQCSRGVNRVARELGLDEQDYE